MKNKSFFTIVLTSILVLVGCEKEAAYKTLNEIQVSQTYVSIDPNGSTATVTIESTTAWELASECPDWVTLSCTSGSANSKTDLKISAEACDYGREAVLQISAGVHTQFITVRQGNMKAEEVSCKTAMTGTAGKTYKIKGAVTKITNTTYGNLYLTDGSITPDDKLDENAAYVYGTLDSKGAEKNFLSLGIEVGDIITVEGPLSYYGTTPELVNVTVIKIEKSLLKIDKAEAALPAAGGKVTVKAAYKGSGVFYTIKDEYKPWISVESIEYIAGVPSKLVKEPADTAVFTIAVAQSQESDARTGKIEITSKKGSNSSVQTLTIGQEGLKGTKQNPFTVAEAIEYCTKNPGESTTDFYVKGIVSKFYQDKKYTEQYGNASFFISSDGEYLNDKSHDFEAYQAYWLGNAAWKESNAQLEIGAEVVVCGKFTSFNGQAETAGKKGYVYSVNGAVSDEEGIGTLDAPFTPAGVVAASANIPSTKVYVSGKIASILNNGTFSAQYGNASFWLSADGSYKSDKSVEFEAYRVLYLGNRKWVEGDTQIALGDDVVVYGPVTTYGDTVETGTGAYIYSLNGKTE